jgi:hypothetical protein
MIYCEVYFRQRSLLQIRQVTFQLWEATYSNDDTIIATFSSRLQLRMVDAPPQRNLEQRQAVLLCHTFDETECLKVGVFEVTSAVHVTEGRILGEPSVLWSNVCRLDFAAEKASRKRIVDNNVNFVLPATWDEFGLNITSCYRYVSLQPP